MHGAFLTSSFWTSPYSLDTVPAGKAPGKVKVFLAYTLLVHRWCNIAQLKLLTCLRGLVLNDGASSTLTYEM